MKKIYLSQVNNSYGNNAFLPYSVGLLWSYASSLGCIASNYRLGGFIYLREDLDVAMAKIEDPSVLALSCYIWNWSYSMQLAKAVKQAYPSCRIIIGGPESPDRSDGFFVEHPYVDIIAHGEGEQTFADLLINMLSKDDLSGVSGISYNKDGVTIKTRPRERLSDLNAIPSPYLTGLFDQLMSENPKMDFHASQETNRGCPYSCTFCDWGSAVMSKVRQFSDNRLTDEIDWFGRKGIDLIYNCDANYGMLKRDVDLTRYMTATKHRYGGYPNKFRAAYAKKSDDKVFEIASMLNNAGMNKGITLSMQSMDPHVLDLVKRSNIKMDDFKGLLDRYKTASIPTYTEMILGLPGETLDGFVNGLDQVLEAGQHDNISIYMCMLLKNSEMAKPDYMAEHGIKTKRVPILSLHGSVLPDGIVEMNDIVIATNSMPYDDWKEAHLISVLVQALHCQGLTHIMAQHQRNNGIGYMEFYRNLLTSARNSGGILGREIRYVEEEIARIFDHGLHWNTGLEGYGDVSWPLEERMFIALQRDVLGFLDQIEGIDPRVKHLQRSCVVTEHDSSDIYADLSEDLSMLLFNEPNCRKARFSASRYCPGDRVTYAQELVWYGRKSSQTKRRIERM